MFLKKRRQRLCLIWLLSLAFVFSGCTAAQNGSSASAPTPPPVPGSTPKLTYNENILPQIPDGSETPTSPVGQTFLVGAAGASYRTEPVFREENILNYLAVGSKVTCLEEQGDYLRVRTDEGEEGWCHSWYLDAEDRSLDAERDARYLSDRLASESFIPINGEPVIYCIAAVLNCRAEADVSSALLYQVHAGEELRVYGRDGEFYLVRLEDGRVCYCSVDWLSYSPSFAVCPGGVDLRVFIPTAQIRMLYASSNNATGEALYPAIPLLERTTAEKLLDASRIFQQDGFALLVCDAYRPMTAQSKLYSVVQDTRFIQDPASGPSLHQRGRAVDISLIDLKTGREIEMPTSMHSFTTQASRINQALWSKTAEKNVAYMTRVMSSVGFEMNTAEWWHFEYTGEGGYLDADIDLSALQILPVSQYEPPV